MIWIAGWRDKQVEVFDHSNDLWSWWSHGPKQRQGNSFVQTDLSRDLFHNQNLGVKSTDVHSIEQRH